MTTEDLEAKYPAKGVCVPVPDGKDSLRRDYTKVFGEPTEQQNWHSG